MRRGRLLAGEALIVKKGNRYEGSSTAFQRLKCSYVASECEDKVQGLQEKMGSLCTEVQELRAEVSAMHKGASAWWSNVDKHFLQEPFKKKLASLQEEMKGLRTVTTASLHDMSSIRANLDSHVAAMETLFSSLQCAMSKEHNEQQDSCTRVNTQTELSADLVKLSDDVARMVAELEIQLRNKMDSMHKEMTDLRAQYVATGVMEAVDVNLTKKLDILQRSTLQVIVPSLEVLQKDMTRLRADLAKVGCHADADVASSVAMLNKKLDLGLSADMSKMGIMDRLQEEIKGLRADMAKLGCYRNADVAPPSAPIDVGEVPCTHDFSLKIDNILRELQGLHAHAAMTHEKETAYRANMENYQLDLSNRMGEAMKHLYADVAAAREGDANMGKVQMDLSNKMHAEMDRLYGVLAAMNGNANGVWSNVMAQEKDILKMQELMYTVMSNVESYTTDKERANVVLVKIVSAFLACTTAFYAWIVWSF